MSFLQTSDERYYNGIQYSAGSFDAPDYSPNNSYVLAEGMVNAAYGALIHDGLSDVDVYNLGLLSPGSYTIRVWSTNWDYSNSFYGGFSSVKLYSDYGIWEDTSYTGYITFDVEQPTSYYIKIDGGFQSTEYEVYYTSSGVYFDTTPPSAIAANPADLATDVPVGSNLVVTFNEAIQRGTGNILIKTGTDTVVASYNAATSGNLTFTGSTLTINPSVDLSPGTFYWVEVPAGAIKDLAGNSHAGFDGYEFTTISGAVLPNNPVSGNLVVSGDPALGSTLKVETQGLSDPDGLGSYSYQWLREGVEISGATSSSYIIKNADINKAISSTVSYTDGEGNQEDIISESRYPVSQNTAEFIDLIEMYIVIPGRAPDAGGLSFWSGLLNNGKDFEYIASEMWNSPQTQALYPPSMSTADKVTEIYNNVLDREPDQGGLDFWVNRWDSIGPVGTMLEMIDAIKGYTGNNQEGLVAKQLFMNKIDVGAYLAITHESDDLELAVNAYTYLGDHSLEETIAYVDNQLEVIGQSTLQTASDVLG